MTRFVKKGARNMHGGELKDIIRYAITGNDNRIQTTNQNNTIQNRLNNDHPILYRNFLESRFDRTNRINAETEARRMPTETFEQARRAAEHFTNQQHQRQIDNDISNERRDQNNELDRYEDRLQSELDPYEHNLEICDTNINYFSNQNDPPTYHDIECIQIARREKAILLRQIAQIEYKYRSSPHDRDEETKNNGYYY